jgi:site-specific recombinase XerD
VRRSLGYVLHETPRFLIADGEVRHLEPRPARLALSEREIACRADDLSHTRVTEQLGVSLAAVHSLFRFAAVRHPEHAALIQRVLAIPPKRADRALVAFLTGPEIDALLASPDRTGWIGRRDNALLALALQTGLRVSELIGLRCQDVALHAGTHVRCQGKGRKERCTPLISATAAVLRGWLHERQGAPTHPLFPTRLGGPLSRHAIERLLAKYAARAAQACPTLRGKRLSPHVLRHTSAMQLLQAGVDTTVIALWLGHETIRTTQIYLHADLGLKERALARTAPPGRRSP